jgi:hypothetical protein
VHRDPGLALLGVGDLHAFESDLPGLDEARERERVQRTEVRSFCFAAPLSPGGDSKNVCPTRGSALCVPRLTETTIAPPGRRGAWGGRAVGVELVVAQAEVEVWRWRRRVCGSCRRRCDRIVASGAVAGRESHRRPSGHRRHAGRRGCACLRCCGAGFGATAGHAGRNDVANALAMMCAIVFDANELQRSASCCFDRPCLGPAGMPRELGQVVVEDLFREPYAGRVPAASMTTAPRSLAWWFNPVGRRGRAARGGEREAGGDGRAAERRPLRRWARPGRSGPAGSVGGRGADGSEEAQAGASAPRPTAGTPGRSGPLGSPGGTGGDGSGQRRQGQRQHAEIWISARLM